jgi:hypothetical protein
MFLCSNPHFLAYAIFESPNKTPLGLAKTERQIIPHTFRRSD